MEYGPLPLDRAEGAVLAHGVRLSGRSFKKGRVLSAEDVAALRAAGHDAVVAVRLEPGDVPEDAAAERVARAACGPGARCAAPFTGRCNLYADHGGLALIDRDRVDALNLIDESLTLATVPPFDLVEPGQMLATVKVIPFAAAEPVVAAAVAAAEREGPLVRVAALRAMPVGLVLTRLPDTRESILDKTVATMRDRLGRLGSHIAAERRCDHSAEAVGAAVRDLADAGCRPVLVFGASAIVDRHDVVPAGMVRAGGTIDHFGMPVDPGNLLLLAHRGDVSLVGLPGCARSPKINGLDWILWRLLAGVPIARTDVMRMGAGGLLKEFAGRPQPRSGPRGEDAPPATDGEPTDGDAPRMPRIGAVVLAAGQSRRAGGINKLLAEIDGVPILGRVLDAVAASGAGPVVVVTGHQADRVRAACAGRDVSFAHNPDYADGLSTSLRTGVAALPGGLDGAIVCLGDMPRVSARHIDRLVAAFNPLEGRAICVPTAGGKRGNPVLWAARFFPDMQEIAGDVGARHLIGIHEDVVAEVPVDDDGVLLDLDTPEALRTAGAAI
jgi:molybdenum cofactor cytidylyltransferase